VPYTPPSGNAVDLIFSGAYTAPAGSAVELNFNPAAPVTHEATLAGALDDAACLFAAVAQVSATIDAALADTMGALACVPMAAAQVAGTLDDIAGDLYAVASLSATLAAVLDDVAPAVDATWSAGVWRGLETSRRSLHADQSSHVDLEISGILRQARKTIAQRRQAWGQINPLPASVDAGWTQVPTRRAALVDGWDKVPSKHQHKRGGYQAAPRRAVDGMATWQAARAIDRESASKYVSPPRQADDFFVRYGGARRVGIETDAQFGIGTPTWLQKFIAPWGVADPHSWIFGGWFYPPLPPPPPYVPSTELVFYQRAEDYTGGAILEFNRPCWAWPLFKADTHIRPGAIIVLHTIHVVRLPDLVNVPVLSVQLQFDIDSWAWGVSLSLQTAAAIALLEPIDGEPVQVRINLDGYYFHALIESWTESRQFGETTYTATGRSPLALFASPYAPIRSHLEPDQMTAAQLIDAELANTNWSAAYHADLLLLCTSEWLVPGGVWSYQNKSPIDAVLQVAGAIGARAYSDRTSNLVRIEPRYPISPWNWAAATADKTIPLSVARSVSTQLTPQPDYNHIFVSGQNQGVLVSAYRQGTAGDRPAPMITDSLITYANAGRERARNQLSNTGRQARVTIDLPLNEVTGLIEPGQLIEVSDAIPWRGLAVGTTISAAHGAIGQRVEIERHYS